MEYKIVTNMDADTIVWRMADELIRDAVIAKDPMAFLAVSVLGGDRHLCCDEAVVAYENGIAIGMTTIAPKGESGADMPEIVGLFVLERYRRQRVGRKLVLCAIERCRVRGLLPLRVSLLSKAASALFKSLPPTMLADVQIRDMSHLSLF